MEYKRFKDKIVIKIDRGEEIIEQIAVISEKESIRLAVVNALGAVGKFEVGLFDTSEKKYYTTGDFNGDFEITSLHGTVTTMGGKHYSHIHMSAADHKGIVYGGHLKNAYVSGTCEMIIDIIDGTVERKFSDEAGLNLFNFSDS